MKQILRAVWVLILSLAIVLSCTVVGDRLTDPAAYSHTIEVLDHNRAAVLGLSAAAAATSGAVTALPDDICTPLAEEISEFTAWFLMILGVIYLEKYLLTILGTVACYLLIPAGCGALLIHSIFGRESLRRLGWKLVIFALALVLVVPTSVWVSDQINAIYDQSIETTLQSAGTVTENLIGQLEGAEGENTSVIDEAASILGNPGGSAAGVIGKFKNVLNRFVEATAVLIVTTCLIPLLVILFFGWIAKTLWGVQLVVPLPPVRPGKAAKAEQSSQLAALE